MCSVNTGKEQSTAWLPRAQALLIGLASLAVLTEGLLWACSGLVWRESALEQTPTHGL